MSEQSPSLIRQLTTQVIDVLNDIERATSDFQTWSGIRCRAGCGQCCLKPAVEARPVELLPIAWKLSSMGQGEEAEKRYAQATASPDGVCVFYEPHPTDISKGRCGIYADRPSLCRLFGFAATRRKDTTPALVSCTWQKQLQSDEIAAAQAAIDAGAEVPTFSDFSLRIRLLAPGTGLDALLPINQALARALEKVWFAFPDGDPRHFDASNPA